MWQLQQNQRRREFKVQLSKSSIFWDSWNIIKIKFDTFLMYMLCELCVEATSTMQLIWLNSKPIHSCLPNGVINLGDSRPYLNEFLKICSSHKNQRQLWFYWLHFIKHMNSLAVTFHYSIFIFFLCTISLKWNQAKVVLYNLKEKLAPQWIFCQTLFYCSKPV